MITNVCRFGKLNAFQTGDMIDNVLQPIRMQNVQKSKKKF